MKFSILALDYDGTIATDGVLDPEVRIAIKDVRARGVIVILVTGRRLDHLRSDVGDLRFVDAVVAENGAVITFPQSGRSTVLGTPPPKAFLEELNHRKINVIVGECIIEAEATYAPAILAIICELELPLSMLFNRSRLMVLTQSISKATGLREALRMLRLSIHNLIAIGDAENDHELLTSCEIGVAVEWGSERLKAIADEILEGTGPSAVADFIRKLATHPRLSPQRTGRRRLLLGSTEKGEAVSLAVRGRNLLIAGDPRSGKSWIAGLLAEQLILHHYCVCLIDPEGDYRSFESLPGVMVFGNDEPPPRLQTLARALRYPDTSVIIDLSKMSHDKKHDYVISLLLMLKELRRSTGLPHRIVIDEAHYFLYGSNIQELLDLELAGYTLITYRVSALHSDVLAASEAIIVTHETDLQEVKTLRTMFSTTNDKNNWENVLGNLPLGEAALLPNTEEARGGLLKFKVASRLTFHVRHRNKYFDVLVSESKAFVFDGDGSTIGLRAHSVKEFIEILKTISPHTLDGHLRRNDFSRWFAGIFGDQSMALQLHEVEHRYKLHGVPNINEVLVQLIHDRYSVSNREITCV